MKKINPKTKSTGRSMIEMLGVLAIIGVLSIGGLAGYKIAMNYHRANETIHDVMLRATNVPMKWDDYSAKAKDYEFTFADMGAYKEVNPMGYGVSVYSEGPNSASGYAFRVEVSNVPSEVCKRINNMNPVAVDKIEPASANCEVESGILDKMTFYFDENFGSAKPTNPNNPTDPNNPDDPDDSCTTACGACEKCVDGSCVADTLKNGVSCASNKCCQNGVCGDYCGDGGEGGSGCDKTADPCCDLSGTALECCKNPALEECNCNPTSCDGTCLIQTGTDADGCPICETDPNPCCGEPTVCYGSCEALEKNAQGCNVCVDKSVQIQTGECCDEGLSDCCPLNGNTCNECEPTNPCCGKEPPTCGECEHLVSDEVECWRCEADSSKNGNSCSSNGEVGSCSNGTCKTTGCKEGKVSCGTGTNTWCCNEGNTCGVSTGECCLDGYCCQGEEKPYKYFVYQFFETRYGCCITDPEETPEYSPDPNNELATSSRVCCTAEKPVYHVKVSACGDVYDCFEDTPELTSKHFASCCQAGGICETITTYGYGFCPNGYGDWYTPEMSVMSVRDCLSEVEPEKPAPEPETYCTEITKKSGSVYRVCCDGGNATQVAGGFYVCNSPCTGNCTETLISE